MPSGLESSVDVTLNEDKEDRVQALARSMTRLSNDANDSQMPTLSRTLTQLSHYANPFEDSKSDASLDPTSEKFDVRAWLKAVMKIVSRDPERYAGRTAGVSFRNLNVHGFGSPTDYQTDVGNIWIGMFSTVKGWLGLRKGLRKIQILREFDGLVKSGEMLVVLGRPGR